MNNNLKEHNLYGNCEMYHSDGTLMFKCQLKKINWYLSRGLAEITQKEPYTKAKLLFEPKGKGNHGDDFSLEEQKNICSVCGVGSELSRHHIVPSCYRKHFPLENKSHYHHDIVVICRACHDSYENVAYKVKQELSEEYNAPLSVASFKNDWKFSGVAHAYKNKTTIREDVRQKWETELTEHFGHLPSESEIDILINRKVEITELIRNHGKIIVESQDSLQGFVEMWREHFIEASEPKFMSKHWTVTRPI